jgi:hypothetical protein
MIIADFVDFLHKMKRGLEFKFFNSKQRFKYLGYGNYRTIPKHKNKIYKLNAVEIKNIRSIYDPKRRIVLAKRKMRGDELEWFY